MSLNAKKVKSTGGSRVEQENLVGTYPARLVQVLDFGLQNQRAYQGKDKKPAYDISITWELLDEFLRDEDGEELEDKPRWISERFPFHNLSAEMAKSTKRYLALDPKCDLGGDWVELLGTPALVTLVTNESGGKTYTNVASVAAMRAKDAKKAPDLVNDSVSFSMDEPDVEVFNSLPDWIQEVMKENLEYNGSPLQEALGEDVIPQDDGATDTDDSDGEDDSEY